MFPSCTALDLADSGSGDAKLLGYIFLNNTSVQQLTNFQYLGFIKNSLMALLAAMVTGNMPVSRNIGKVFDTIVGAILIDVMGMVSFGTRAKEDTGDQWVNLLDGTIALLVKCYVRVAAVVNLKSKHPPRCNALMVAATISQAGNTANIALI